jgi:hypothetical protein
MTQETESKPIGRPTSYTKEKAQTICRMIENGMTLVAICHLPDMPDISTVYDWQDAHVEFAESYARARQRQADTFAAMVMTEAFNSHDAQIGRLRIDALKWTASKLAPKKYGDKIEVESNSQQNFKISFSVPDRNTQDSLQNLEALPDAIPQIIDIQPEPVESE